MSTQLVIFDLGPQLLRALSHQDRSIEDAFASSDLQMTNDVLSAMACSSLGGIQEARGVTGAFQELKRAGIRIAIATSLTRALASIVVARAGWFTMVDVLVTREDIDGARPTPRIVQAAMARAGVFSPGRVAKVADTPAGLLEGYVARCGLVVAIPAGTHDDGDDDLELYPHTHRIATAALVPELLRRLARHDSSRTMLAGCAG